MLMQVGWLQKGKGKAATQKNKTRVGGGEWKNKGTHHQGTRSPRRLLGLLDP
jgi:hypothetical protein